MLNILQHLMHISDPERLRDFDNTLFENPDVHIYWKDKNGKYMGCNTVMAISGGFESANDLCGFSDYDTNVCWSDYATEITANDKVILSTGKTHHALEPFRDCKKQDYKFYSLKFPLRTLNQKIIGITGISFRLSEDLLPLNILQLAHHPGKDDFKVLTKRQRECLYYLVRGMRIKDIAKKTQLSPKTVEHYLEAVKYKLNCKSRSELIMKATHNYILPLN